MRLRLSTWMERVRSSLFFTPMAGVVLAVALGLLGVAVDSRIGKRSTDLPLGLTSTVESARALLSTVAAATITFAGIAFSVAVLVLQLASTQYSPRVVHTMFRDPFNRRVMALVVGTFTYCVVVLRSVRSALEDGGDPVVPNLSVAVAVFLGIATILAVVAFIDHSAHSMDISEILERVRRETTTRIRDEWPVAEPGRRSADRIADPSSEAHIVRFARSGWVQLIDTEALMEVIPEGGIMRVETYPGRYAIEGTPLCAITPPPTEAEACDEAVCDALAVGDTRTMQQDVSYGLRQLVDVALKGLSPGVNDPTTAQDAIFHAGAVLAEVLRRDPPPRQLTGESGRLLVLSQQFTHDELVRLTFDEVRRVAVDHPTVCVYVLETLSLLSELVEAEGLPDRSGPLVEQAQHLMSGCERADLLPADLEVVRVAYDKRFGATLDPAVAR